MVLVLGLLVVLVLLLAQQDWFLIGNPQMGTPSDGTSSFALPSLWPHRTMPPLSCALEPFELFIEGIET